MMRPADHDAAMLGRLQALDFRFHWPLYHIFPPTAFYIPHGGCEVNIPKARCAVPGLNPSVRVYPLAALSPPLRLPSPGSQGAYVHPAPADRQNCGYWLRRNVRPVELCRGSYPSRPNSPAHAIQVLRQ